MNIRKIILLRHGESLSNRNEYLTGRIDVDLTREGRRQAKRAASFLEKHIQNIDLIYSSPLKRTLNTAKEVKSRMKIPIKRDDLLIETNFGDWEQKSKKDLVFESDWKEYIKDPFHFHFPGGESPQDVKKRVLAFKNKIKKDDSWKNILLVSHYTPISFFILSVFGNENNKISHFKVSNASISIIDIYEDFEYINMLNYVP